VCQHRRLVCDAVLHGQPVKRLQQRRGVGAASALTDNAGEVVLCPLKPVDGRGRRTIQQSVAVIKPRGDDTAGDCLCHLVGQQTTHVTKGAGVIVTRPSYVGGVVVKSEVGVDGDAERLDPV